MFFLINAILGILVFINTSFALTFKSTGEVISSSGEILEKSYADQYQEALNKYISGEAIEDWPIVELSDNGSPIKKPGYFGEKILEVGAPLFTAKKVQTSGDLMKNLSKLNGFIDDSMLSLTMIANSNEAFREGKNINFEQLEETYSQMVAIGAIGQDLSDFDDLDEYFDKISIHDEDEFIDAPVEPKELILNPETGEIIDPETGLRYEGQMENVIVFDPETGEWNFYGEADQPGIIIGIPEEPEKPIDGPFTGDIDKTLTKENLSNMVGDIKEIRNNNDIDFEETKSQLQSTVKASLFGSELSDTLEKLKGDLEAQKSLIADIENVAKEAGFGSAKKMYMEMGMNTADLDITNEAGKVDSPGVETDPNACNNNGGAC